MMMKKAEQPAPDIDFDLRQLEIFRQVVDLKSFSKAAKAVFLSQASVSERIATLETHVGTRLLDRLGRQVIPTKAGELLYKHATLLLEMKRNALLEMQEFLGVQHGEIRMGGSTIPGEYILPKVLGAFRRHYPLLTVNIMIGDSSEIETRVLEGELELGVIGSKGRHQALIYAPLWEDELLVIVPADHHLAGQKELTLETLFKEPFIQREIGSGTLEILEDALQGAEKGGSLPLNVVARFGTSTAVKEAIKAGLGISVLSWRAVETELAGGVLKALRVEGVTMQRRFYLIRDRRRTASPLCQALLDFLRSLPKERVEQS